MERFQIFFVFNLNVGISWSIYEILSIPQNIVMYLNNVMGVIFQKSIMGRVEGSACDDLLVRIPSSSKNHSIPFKQNGVYMSKSI